MSRTLIQYCTTSGGLYHWGAVALTVSEIFGLVAPVMFLDKFFPTVSWYRCGWHFASVHSRKTVLPPAKETKKNRKTKEKEKLPTNKSRHL